MVSTTTEPPGLCPWMPWWASATRDQVKDLGTYSIIWRISWVQITSVLSYVNKPGIFHFFYPHGLLVVALTIKQEVWLLLFNTNNLESQTWGCFCSLWEREESPESNPGPKFPFLYLPSLPLPTTQMFGLKFIGTLFLMPHLKKPLLEDTWTVLSTLHPLTLTVTGECLATPSESKPTQLLVYRTQHATKVISHKRSMCAMQAACSANPEREQYCAKPGGRFSRAGGQPKLESLCLAVSRQQLQICGLPAPTLGLTQWVWYLLACKWKRKWHPERVQSPHWVHKWSQTKCLVFIP